MQLAEQRSRAVAFILVAIMLASTQDAIVKYMSGSYPAYETIILRCTSSLPILLAWLAKAHGMPSLRTPHWKIILLRSMILCSAYFGFILAIAAMPLANAVSIYFTMPFFVAAFAGPLLGERVPYYRVLAIIAGFIGVLVMERPGFQAFEPAAFFALWSAVGYAVGQMMGRSIAQQVPPLVIANYQNASYLLVSVILGLILMITGFHSEAHKSIAFLTRPFVWPTLQDFTVLLVMGGFAAFAMVCFINAYKSAASSFVAPFEYSAMFWAASYGYFVFNELPDVWHWVGMAIVIAAGLYMLAMDSRSAHTG